MSERRMKYIFVSDPCDPRDFEGLVLWSTLRVWLDEQTLEAQLDPIMRDRVEKITAEEFRFWRRRVAPEVPLVLRIGENWQIEMGLA